jgi:hypothetical protein
LHKYHALLNFVGQNISVLKEMPGNASKAPFYRHLVPLGQERLDALRYVIAAVFGISLSTLMFCPAKFNKAWYLCNQTMLDFKSAPKTQIW